MNSIAINTDFDISTELRDDGLRTIDISCGHEAVGNLVLLRLLTLIDADFFLENKNIDPAIFAQEVRFIIESTKGVASADVSQINLIKNGRDIHYGTVCFTTDCETTCNYELQCPNNQ